MSNQGVRFTRRRRLVAVTGLAVAAVTLAALPASAHPSFSAAAGFGFQPNTSGGTGAVGTTAPYASATSPTLHVRVPFEQTEPFNGSDDTTVDTKIIVPAGWTSPVCGDAKTSINNVSTNNTNQPGSVVAGWSCEIITENSHQVVHFSGPQVVAPATSADSPQWFSFQVTTPSPAVKTTYNGTAGTEGFIVDQQYASGETEHWIPNAAFVGTAPLGSTTTVASGLARTVAAPVPNIDLSVPSFKVTGQRDDSKFKVTVTNNDTPVYSVAGTDLAVSVKVNGVAVADPVTSLTPGTKNLKTGKSATFRYSWAHGSSLQAGDVVDVTACVTLSTGDGPVNSCGSVTSPDSLPSLSVLTTASTLTHRSTKVAFHSKLTNTGTAPILLRSSDVEISTEVSDNPYSGTVTSATDPAKRRLLMPGKSTTFNFTSTLPTLIVGDDVHVETCVNVPGDETLGDNCSLVHLDIAK